MQNVSFMREVFENAAKKVSIVVLSQRQFRSAISFTIKGFLLEENVSVVFVTLTQPATEVLKEIPKISWKNIFVIDAYSGGKPETEEDASKSRTHYIDTPSDITGLLIGIENAFNSLPGRKIVIIDSLSVLATYNPHRIFGKFLYLFTNKIKLEEETLVLFATEESVEKDALDTAKQFADKTYDYSGVYLSQMELQ